MQAQKADYTQTVEQDNSVLRNQNFVAALSGRSKCRGNFVNRWNFALLCERFIRCLDILMERSLAMESQKLLSDGKVACEQMKTVPYHNLQVRTKANSWYSAATVNKQ